MNSATGGAVSVVEEERFILESLAMDSWNAATRASKGSDPRPQQAVALRQLSALIDSEMQTNIFIGSRGQAGSPPGLRAVYQEPLILLVSEAAQEAAGSAEPVSVRSLTEQLQSLANGGADGHAAGKALVEVLSRLHRLVTSRRRQVVPSFLG